MAAKMEQQSGCPFCTYATPPGRTDSLRRHINLKHKFEACCGLDNGFGYNFYRLPDDERRIVIAARRPPGPEFPTSKSDRLVCFDCLHWEDVPNSIKFRDIHQHFRDHSCKQKQVRKKTYSVSEPSVSEGIGSETASTTSSPQPVKKPTAREKKTVEELFMKLHKDDRSFEIELDDRLNVDVEKTIKGLLRQVKNGRTVSADSVTTNDAAHIVLSSLRETGTDEVKDIVNRYYPLPDEDEDEEDEELRPDPLQAIIDLTAVQSKMDKVMARRAKAHEESTAQLNHKLTSVEQELGEYKRNNYSLKADLMSSNKRVNELEEQMRQMEAKMRALMEAR